MGPALKAGWPGQDQEKKREDKKKKRREEEETKKKNCLIVQQSTVQVLQLQYLTALQPGTAARQHEEGTPTSGNLSSAGCHAT